MIAHCACDDPLEKGNRPDRRHPPSARRATSRGASEEDATASGVLAPDVDLRLFRIAADDPLMLAQHRVDPAGGGAAFREGFHDAGKRTERRLQTAEPAGLQHPEQTGLAYRRHGFAAARPGWLRSRRHVAPAPAPGRAPGPAAIRRRARPRTWSVQIDSVALEILQRTPRQRAFMRGPQDDARGRHSPPAPAASVARTGTSGRPAATRRSRIPAAGVDRSLPAAWLNSRNAAVITAQTVWLPTSSGPVLQQPSR